MVCKRKLQPSEIVNERQMAHISLLLSPFTTSFLPNKRATLTYIHTVADLFLELTAEDRILLDNLTVRLY